MNDPRAVHRERGDIAALHEIDEDGRHAGLDYMRADAPDNAGVVPLGRDDRIDHAPHVGAAENGGEGIEP